MKNTNKLLSFLITLCLLICVAMPVFTSYADDNTDYSKLEYYISSYDIQIDVLEDNVLNVTENISAFFNVQSHGIYRYIPLSNNVVREDGTSGKTSAKVKNVKISEIYDSEQEHGNCIFKIGDPNNTIIGAKDYTISYSYVMGRDIGDGFDELYYNIIGEGWKTYIQNVTFTITMPKEFDESKLGFSAGNYGTSGVGDIEYSVNGNKISGRLTNDLAPNQAFTVRLELPENYFIYDYSDFYVKLAFEVLIPFIVLLVVILLWAKYGKDKKVVDKVEFYPPEGMSSLEVAYWYKGNVEERDVVPLLIELANEGYISIEEKETDGNFRINKIKKYDGDDENKKIFYNGLFSSDTEDYTTGLKLKKHFYHDVLKILDNMNTYDNREKVFSAKSLTIRICCWIASVLSGIASIVISTQIIGGDERVIAALIGTAIALCAFGFSFFIRKRTDEGHEILQKIKNFKSFLENEEKENIESLVEFNPSYFFNILPYAYVLGVSDAWIKKFEDIVIQPPSWYRGVTTGSTMYSRITFLHFINNTLRSTTKAVSSAKSSSTGSGYSTGTLRGGGYSGGGFSGGGSGGGGGGRW
ncbi:MAG: DUF2207 domain-containing protein [Eubacterium sp.]|nr:DUF2207 domain-containing protein [Eubacterium sp.]